MKKHLIPAPPPSPLDEMPTLIEHRIVHQFAHCELNLFETRTQAQAVPLRFDDLVITAMLRGKKHMQVGQAPSFDYLPGETVLVPAGQAMSIDFPLASPDKPTQCLALALDGDKVNRLLHYLNETYPKQDGQWELNLEQCFLSNSRELAASLERLVKLPHQPQALGNALAEAILQELLVYLMQQQNRLALAQNPQQDLISELTHFLKEKMLERVSLEDLIKQTHISSSKLYRIFQRELGMSPGHYLLQLRLERAKMLLLRADLSIAQVAFESGFDDANYFQRQFKREIGLSPSAYRQRWLKGQS